jgi:hypothetical protein
MSWDKDLPLGSVSVSLGDDAIRLNNDHLEDGLSREHEFPGTYGTTNLRHKFPQVATLAAMTAITGKVDGMLVHRTEMQILFERVAAAMVPLFGYGYMTAAQRDPGLATGDLPAGYKVLESDTGNTWLWNGSAWVRDTVVKGWAVFDTATTSNQAASPVNTWDDVDGNYGGVLGFEIIEPNDGRNYEIVVTCVPKCIQAFNQHMAFQLMEDSGAGYVAVDQLLVSERARSAQLATRVSLATPGATYKYKVQVTADSASSAVCAVNPTSAHAEFNYVTGDFAGISTYTRIIGTIREKLP